MTMNEELKCCPFCGSTKLKINSKSTKAGYNGRDNIVYRATYSVRCNKCHARGGAIGGKVLSLENYPINIPYSLPSWATTWQELKAKAVAAWNNRLEIN